MREAWIRLAPTPSFKLVRSSAEQRTLYSGLKFPPGDPPPVCVDHDVDEVVGEVFDVLTRDDPVLGNELVVPWLVARCRLYDGTDWVRRGVGASISTKAGFEGEILGGWPILRNAYLHHIAVCVRRTPIEPAAAVIHVFDEEPTPGDGVLLRRNFGSIVAVR